MKQLLSYFYWMSCIIGCRGAIQSVSGLSLGGPTKLKACKSLIYTEGSLWVENKEHLVDVIIFVLGD